MNQLTLEWEEEAQIKTETIQDGQPSKNPGTVRVGRARDRCDLVITHPTVSGLHVEIFFNQHLQEFHLRNLRQSNPPVVDGKILPEGQEATLKVGSQIYLGQVEIKVLSTSFSVPEFPATVLLPPLTKATVPLEYGLKCARCDRISPYSQLELGCPWCGTSLAAAASVVLPP